MLRARRAESAAPRGAERTGLPRPAAIRLLAALTELGWLVRQAGSECCLSMKAVDLTGRLKACALAARTGETIALNRIDGLGRICIESADSASDLSSVMRVGDRVPLTLGASLRALMTCAATEVVEAAVAQVPQGRRRTHRAALARIRVDGFALSRGEMTSGNVAPAVPIFDPDGAVWRSLSLIGPEVRFDPQERALVALLRRAGTLVTRRDGGAWHFGRAAAGGR